jgi:sulfate transport system permease protein
VTDPRPGARAGRRIGDGRRTRAALIVGVIAVSVLYLVMPIVIVFVGAFASGVPAFVDGLTAPDTLHAIGLTVVTALIAVPVNTGFGIAAAWAIAKFEFRGRKLLMALIEVPFSVSPVVAGVAYLFVFGVQGLFGQALQDAGIKIMFALPGIVLASMFVTAPLVVRELVPLMMAQGRDDEEAALSLGAPGWQTFLLVTLPNIRWALLYGVILCNARVMGEFGAVSVVSGNVRGQTNTLPLQIESLYHDYDAVGAFAAATTLTALALVTIVLKALLERRRGGTTPTGLPAH